MTTNSSRRDSRVQDALETDRFPTAAFQLTEPIDLGDTVAGEGGAVVATGELTVHRVTNTVEVPLQAQLVDGTAVVIGSIVFSDYGVEVPTSPIVVSVEEHGTHLGLITVGVSV